MKKAAVAGAARGLLRLMNPGRQARVPKHGGILACFQLAGYVLAIAVRLLQEGVALLIDLADRRLLLGRRILRLRAVRCTSGGRTAGWGAR